MQLVSSLAGIVVYAMGIVVLIHMFKKEGVLKGILGIICILYAYIWGWMHATEENIKNIMWIWTGLWILTMIIAIITATSNAAAAIGS